MSSTDHINLILPSQCLHQWTEDLEALGFVPDPMAQRRQAFGMIKVFDPSQFGSVRVSMGDTQDVWQGDHPALYEQITTRLGTNQWSDFVVTFAYQPRAEQETLVLLRWVAQHYPKYAAAIDYHHLLEPSDMAALDREMLYWSGELWDDND
ncbi:hypothetical protein [Herpetosiphon gulosus]|uniref:DUF4253 domain-containing protein n=1 Tax=Herpetosiphon gulosus TaxID=1973496 RepID=A0ABP9X9T7_9CHLR